jgi:uncharacterized membrane protein (DUF373 family)
MENGNSCRICFGTDVIEGNPLISPCRCRGTMKYVHLECLQQWRLMSGRNKSFYQCDQCGYQYRLSRVGLYHFLTHEVFISAITFLVFLLLVLLCGYFGRYIMNSWITWFSDDYQYYDDGGESDVRAADADGGVVKLRYGVDNEIILDPDSWTYHMLSGTFIVGILSFINMGLFFNFNFRWGAGERNDGMSIILVVMVIIGVFRSLYLIHGEVKKRVRKYGLKAAESVVLDIGEEAAD